MYYDYVGCDLWKKGCGNCPQKKQYPVTWLKDRSEYMLSEKVKAFSGVNKMVLCPPSDWLHGEVKKSYLNQYKIVTVNNGIDKKNFRPMDTDKTKDLKKDNKVIILGVIFSFDKRKGLDSFNYLAENLPENYEIIIVGFEDKEKYMNSRIRMIPRTTNVDELAEYYSAADMFVNPTLEENFPSVNIEALACGTPIVTYRTGGATEAIDSETGIIVERDNKEELLKQVLFVGENKPFDRERCIERSKCFTKEKMVSKYLEIYKEVINND